ncbi:MAG: aspartate aminotransferase family protein [Candidatus Omnitrophica bacterium]|nr:aspartate aminotransferase family protein [Candidatus Omnitrophota bacterium]
MTKKEVFECYDQYVFPTYTRLPAIFVKGKGSVLTDIDGKKYMDLFPGWGVSNVGHCHPKVMAAVRDQINKLIHIPNNFFGINQARLARELVRLAFPGKVFFCNSGAEANEAAIKFSRLFGKGERFEIITTLNSFHGRTMGALSATGQEKYQRGFAPLPAGFVTVPFNDINAVRSAVNERTAAIMIEPVQGEGGINVADVPYMKALRELCDERGLLLILDEVQTGFGRTGKMFAFQHYGIEPDIITMAKGLGGGLPIGAMLACSKHAHLLQPGMHGTTFGGSPLVAKAALGALEAIAKDKMLKNSRVLGVYLTEKLNAMKSRFPIIKEVRGLGLMIGVELTIEGKGIFETCFQNGLIINCTQGKVLRIMPALNITRKQLDKALDILEKAILKNDPSKNRGSA